MIGRNKHCCQPLDGSHSFAEKNPAVLEANQLSHDKANYHGKRYLLLVNLCLLNMCSHKSFYISVYADLSSDSSRLSEMSFVADLKTPIIISRSLIKMQRAVALPGPWVALQLSIVSKKLRYSPSLYSLAETVKICKWSSLIAPGIELKMGRWLDF